MSGQDPEGVEVSVLGCCDRDHLDRRVGGQFVEAGKAPAAVAFTECLAPILLEGVQPEEFDAGHTGQRLQVAFTEGSAADDGRTHGFTGLHLQISA